MSRQPDPTDGVCFKTYMCLYELLPTDFFVCFNRHPLLSPPCLFRTLDPASSRKIKSCFMLLQPPLPSCSTCSLLHAVSLLLPSLPLRKSCLTASCLFCFPASFPLDCIACRPAFATATNQPALFRPSPLRLLSLTSNVRTPTASSRPNQLSSSWPTRTPHVFSQLT